MDPYSLKRDNRKKFQDKQRLKHRHATPSDRKYRALKFQENQNEKDETGSNEEGDHEEEEVEPPSNAYRYHEDVSMAFEDPAELQRDLEANKKIRDVLRSKDEQEEPLKVSRSTKDSVTTKALHSMAVNDLNDILGNKSTKSSGERLIPIKKTTPKAGQNTPNEAEKTVSSLSMVPDELQSAQDFLDDLI